VDNPVQISDVEARFRSLADAEKATAEAWLDDAWAIIQLQVPGLPQRVTSGELPNDVVKAIVAAMVIRVLRNPEAIRSWTVDDASFTRDTALSAGLLYATPDELALLSTSTSGAFTIRPAGANPHALWRSW
jgi:hypothetical protein